MLYILRFHPNKNVSECSDPIMISIRDIETALKYITRSFRGIQQI